MALDIDVLQLLMAIRSLLVYYDSAMNGIGNGSWSTTSCAVPMDCWGQHSQAHRQTLQADAQYNRDVARMGGNADGAPDEDYNAFMSELGMGRPDARGPPGSGPRDARDFNQNRPHPGLGSEQFR